MRIKVIITLAFVTLLLSVAIIPVATASDTAPGTIERTTPVETSIAASSAWSLAPWAVESGSVTLSLDAAGNNEASSTITCMKPSDAATVRRAFMIAATKHGGGSISDGDITIDGNPITWDYVIPNVLGSYNYFTEVTALIKAKIDAAPAGPVDFTIVEVNKNTDIDGEILAVIFDDPAQAATNYIALLFGSQAMGGDTFTINLDRPICKADSDLVLDLSLGISYSYQVGGAQYSIIDVNGQRLSTAAGGEDDGAPYNGGLITVGGVGDSNANPPDPYATPANCRSDDELYNLIPFVNDGDTSITISTRNPSNDDNLMFAALFLSSKVPLGEALDYYAHPVTSDGDEEWFGQTNDSCYDGDAARSGNITDGQSTSLRTTVTGPGVVVFYWKVSSQAKKDVLQFYVDDDPVGKPISGEVDWQQGRSQFFSDDGNHTLEWRYTKDRSGSAGQDCAWVDRVVVRPRVVDHAERNYEREYLELLTSLGVTGVLRYLGGNKADYWITADEAATLRKAGFAVGLIWQARRNVIKGGFEAGQKDGQAALDAAKALGFPDSLPIYFVANDDWYVKNSSKKWDATIEYFKGIHNVTGNRPIGAYGQSSLIKKLFETPEETGVTYGWQSGSNSFSSGCWYGDIQVRQTPQYTDPEYTDSKGRKRYAWLDFDDIWTDDWGAWQPTPVETLSVPVDTSTGITTSMTFEAGKHYLIEAKGFFQFAGTSEGIRDAKYQFTTPPFNCCEINQGYTTTWYGNLRIRDREIDWGDCNLDHVYRVPYTGEGTQLDFYIYDDRYDDNSGSVVVNIFQYP